MIDDSAVPKNAVHTRTVIELIQGYTFFVYIDRITIEQSLKSTLKTATFSVVSSRQWYRRRSRDSRSRHRFNEAENDQVASSISPVT